MQGHDEELLSAFHDGELTSAERTTVERMLAESDAAREALDEFGELRGMLQSLPRAHAPGDLRESVLNRIRAERPLPTVSPRRHRLHPAVKWLVSTAACLAIAGGLYVASRTDEPELVAVTTDRATDFSPAPMSAPAEFGSPPPRSAEEPDTIALPMAEPPAAMSDPPAAAAPSVLPVDLEHLRTLIAGGELPSPGELIPDFREVGDQLVLIEYSVVDVQIVYDQVQVILARNGIASVAENGELGPAMDDDSNELYGIYVDAPSDVFAMALQQVSDVSGVVAVNTSTGDEAERQIVMLQSQPALGGNESATDAVATAPPPPPHSARNSPTRGDSTADRTANAVANADEPGDVPAPTEAAASEAEQSAYQVPLAMRRNVGAQSADPADQNRDRTPQAPGASNGQTAPEEAQAARVRVVLVFVPKADE